MARKRADAGESIVRLYVEQNHSLEEVSTITGIPTTTLRRILDDLGVSRNPRWRGDDAEYNALHVRVLNARGRPSECEECGTTEALRYEWANVSGHYEDIYDYRRLCSRCHQIFDHGHAGLPTKNEISEPIKIWRKSHGNVDD